MVSCTSGRDGRLSVCRWLLWPGRQQQRLQFVGLNHPVASSLGKENTFWMELLMQRFIERNVNNVILIHRLSPMSQSWATLFQKVKLFHVPYLRKDKLYFIINENKTINTIITYWEIRQLKREHALSLACGFSFFKLRLI